MIVGYIRGGDEAEKGNREEALRCWGAQRIAWERETKRSWVRPVYEEMAAGLGPGDTVVVSELGQLAGSVRDILVLLAQLHRRQVAFASLKEGFYTETTQGEDALQVLLPLAEMEEDWLRRRAESVRKAKAAGSYKGRKPLAVDEEALRAACARWRAGEITASAAMKGLGLKPNTFYRRVKTLGL